MINNLNLYSIPLYQNIFSFAFSMKWRTDHICASIPQHTKRSKHQFKLLARDLPTVYESQMKYLGGIMGFTKHSLLSFARVSV